MKKYICYKCNKEFNQKCHLDEHQNKKIPCSFNDKLLQLSIKTCNQNEDIKINKEKCEYCEKSFTRKDNLKYHIKNTCKIKKDEIDNKYKMEVIRLKMQLEIEKKEKKELEKCVKKMINKTHINNYNNIINNNYIDNSKHLYLVGYNKEDVSKIDRKELIKALSGYKTPSQLTKLIHCNKNYPEYHNVYIPKINEKYGMVYRNETWELMNKDELATDIYENKRSYIIDNLDDLKQDLSNIQIKRLTKFLNTPDNDEAIINTKEQIKEVLFNHRKLAMYRKTELEKYIKNNKNLNFYQQFLNEYTKESDKHIKTKDLYETFCDWLINKYDIKIPSNKEFIKNIKLYKKVCQVKIAGYSCYGIKNLEIIQDNAK
jgi:hypothetical protein